MSLAEETRALLDGLATEAAGTPHAAAVADARRRLDEPLRVAIAGKVKAGKSTLLNALVGERLAPTDAGECTRVVTWYRHGVRRSVQAIDHEGRAEELAFARTDGAVEIDLDGRDPSTIHHLEVTWPAAALQAMTLIDTPGLASLSTEVSARTSDLVDEDAPAVDAVVYLLRHVHAADVRFLEAFAGERGAVSPVDAIGVLSRADEIGAGRPDALASAAAIADRYRRDPRLRRLCQTVVPAAGLLAETGATLTEAEHAALAALAARPTDELRWRLASVDQVLADDPDPGIDRSDRQRLLERFGLHGLRVGVAEVRAGRVIDATDLAADLLERSGIEPLRRLLADRFGDRADLLRCRSALRAAEAAIADDALPGGDRWRAELERVVAGAHELAEATLVEDLRSGAVVLGDDGPTAERLLGMEGRTPIARLGLPGEATGDQVAAAALAEVARWRTRGSDPLATQAERAAAAVLARTAEGLHAAASSAAP